MLMLLTSIRFGMTMLMSMMQMMSMLMMIAMMARCSCMIIDLSLAPMNVDLCSLMLIDVSRLTYDECVIYD